MLLGSGAAALPLFFLLPQKEPQYQGKSLSDWVVAMHQGQRSQREQARAVVHYLGPHSVPVLLKWLRRPDHPSSLKYRAARAEAQVLNWLERCKLLRPHARPAATDWKESYRFLAVEAFRELGPEEAKAAIPGLIQLLGARDHLTNEVSDTASFAYVVLQKLAPASIPALQNALSSPNEQVWILAADALGGIGPEAKPAVPALRRGLANPKADVRLEAAEVLSKLGENPQEFIPVVIGTLREPNLEDLDEKLGLLLRHPEAARGAVPVLQELLAQVPQSNELTDQTRRSLLSNALAQLGPR